MELLNRTEAEESRRRRIAKGEIAFVFDRIVGALAAWCMVPGASARELLAARARLDKLGADLANRVRDFREAVYINQFAAVLAEGPPECTSDQGARPGHARAIRIHGRTVDEAISPLANAAKEALQTIDLSPSELVLWRGKHERVLVHAVEQALSDSSVMMTRLAMHDATIPARRNDDPVLGGA